MLLLIGIRALQRQLGSKSTNFRTFLPHPVKTIERWTKCLSEMNKFNWRPNLWYTVSGSPLCRLRGWTSNC